MEERSIIFFESDNVPEELKQAISKKIVKNLDSKGFQENEQTSLEVKYRKDIIRFDFTTGGYYSPIQVIAVSKWQ
jgi:hypothetical protein